MSALLAFLLFLCVSAVHAQTGGPVVPDAGSLLQQIQPVKPPAPAPTGTGLRIEKEGGAAPSPGTSFEVNIIRISGNTLFDNPTLHALVADAEGKNMTLPQLMEIAARITDYYRDQGYPLSRAVIRAQVIRDGLVDVEVIEARYGGIVLDNSSRVNDTLLQATLSSLEHGQVIRQADLDHALLLLSDVPGAIVGATLKPGETVGTSDLLVNAAPGPAITANVEMDNYGNRYTGRARIGGTVNFINPLRHGDVFTVGGSSSGSGLSYARLAYDSLLNGAGTRLGGSYSSLDYRLGGSLAPLEAHGTAQVASLWARHPLARSRNTNLYGHIQFDRFQLRDHIDSNAIRTDRHLVTATASLTGDARDTLIAGGVTTWTIGGTTGRVDFDDMAAQSADAVTAGTQGGYSRLNASVVRLQGLSPKNTLYFLIAGQWADRNLDSSQKMIAGGPYSVRAFDIGAISADTGYLATAEFRRDLGSAINGRWQVIAFVDSAHVTVNKKAWIAGINSATLSGAGAGLNWVGANGWSVITYAAVRIGATPELLAPSASARAWVGINKGF